MKKNFFNYARTVRFFSFFLCFLSPFLFFSCSSEVQDSDFIDETSTLRYVADNLYSSTDWTEELEQDRLITSVSVIDGVSSRLNLSPLVVLASVPSDSSKVYPRIENFGSLDISLIPKSLKDTLSKFSESIAKNKSADSFFQNDCLYSLALFYKDFDRIFSGCFDTAEDDKEYSYFESFKLGQPFLDGVYYEVPIKFFGKKSDMTICVFCIENPPEWKIDQIQISDWEIHDGEK